jgi:hypothetical protein
MNLPNVVIAGAAKCGTTSLFKWLVDHPEVGGPREKELFYLMDKGHPLLKQDSNYHDHGLDGYKTYFQDHNSNYKVITEATTHYIYQQTAIDVLSNLDPRPQIIFMLRKPSQRVYSSFRFTQNVLANLDKSVSFSRFIEALRSGRIDSLVKSFSSIDSALLLMNIIKYSQYIDHISNWIPRFGRERIHVFLFEHLRKDPWTVMQELATRIDIEPSFYENYDFKSHNRTVSIKNQFLHRRARRVAELMPQGSVKNVLRDIYLKVQTDREEPQISPEDLRTLNILDDYFEPFNQRLAHELNIDISAWQ